MSLQRRRELARLSKPELIDLIVEIECQVIPDAEIETVAGVE